MPSNQGDLVLKEGMWHEIAFSEGKRRRSFFRWQFEDGRSKGMGTEWDQEVVGKVDPQKRVLCLAQGFLRG